MARISAKRLGRVTEGQVEVAPLLILVGKNNTGKSYFANLLWALGNIQMVPGIDGPKSPRPEWLTSFTRPFDVVEKREYVISPAEAEDIFNKGQLELNSKLPDLLSTVFAHSGFDVTQAFIQPERFPEIVATATPRAHEYTRDPTNAVVDVILRVDGEAWSSHYWPMFAFNDLGDWLSGQMFFDLVGTIGLGGEWERFQRPLYIPAARTGLMLALPALVENALEKTSVTQVADRPMPLTQFIQRMARPADHGPPAAHLKDIRDFVSERMLFGRLQPQNGPVREYRYEPAGTDTQLPLYAVSSMITELAPLLVELGTGLYEDHIIFEEPEAHLHLEAQREMARVIARLVSAGIMVTLTTHSDTFLQQINNLMTLHSHPNKLELMAKFGYVIEDLIDPQNARAFEFCPSPNGTTVIPVSKSSEGFIVPTLNATLLSLARETVELRSGRDA